MEITKHVFEIKVSGYMNEPDSEPVPEKKQKTIDAFFKQLGVLFHDTSQYEFYYDPWWLFKKLEIPLAIEGISPDPTSIISKLLDENPELQVEWSFTFSAKK
jgi:hypothetical protein